MDREILITPNSTVKDAVKLLEEKSIKGVFVIDENDKLLGIFTQGDLRRYILKNGELDASITNAMNVAPHVFFDKANTKKYNYMVCPIVDDNGVLVDVLYNSRYMSDDVNINKECLKDVPVVIMAGGIGSRLFPLTKVIPKPLIPIGDYTITERIIEKFVSWGCENIYLVVNYKSDMIKAYFNEKEKNYNMFFVDEDEFLGTAGGLSLLKGKIDSTFILSNCDIIVDTDYDCVIKTHNMNNNVMTFIGSYKNYDIPYGVLKTDNNGRILDIEEKPEISFLTNTGVYVLEPEVINNLKYNEFANITDIAVKLINKNKNVGVFPTTDKSWLDMGQMDEMRQMIRLFENEI